MWYTSQEKECTDMQISSRFTIAIHIFACIDTFGKDHKVTSEFLAGSINVNPVVVRRLLQQLKGAGLVTVTRGSGGAAIAKPLEDITFLDVYNAMECVDNGELFHFHENPNNNCPVGRNIHHVLDDKLLQIQKAMEAEMRKITIADVVRDTQTYIANERTE
jgi:Rrf2 family protein